jgi:serine/threonine protein kinase
VLVASARATACEAARWALAPVQCSLMSHPLTDIDRVDAGIEDYLASSGEVFRAFRAQDSGCVSYGVRVQGRAWFVKHAEGGRGLEQVKSALRFHRVFRHPAVPALRGSFETAGGLAIVHDWVPGQVLYSVELGRGDEARRRPEHPHTRFRALPIPAIVAALDTIYDVHGEVARQGHVAVDFYDGCILYDFETGATHLCDLDNYRPGPFIVEDERLPGSTRFMAPEELQRGSVIDEQTTVYTMGRTALVLLEDRIPPAMGDVARRASRPARAERYACIADFVDAWRHAVRRSHPTA